MKRIESPDIYPIFKWLVDNYDNFRDGKDTVTVQCNKCKKPYVDFELVLRKRKKDNEAISLLKQCVNWDNKPMTIAISGELGDRIREFIGRCKNA